MSEINQFKKKLQDILNDLGRYDKKAYKKLLPLEEIKKNKYDSDDLNYLLEIPFIKKQKYSFGVRKKLFGNKDKETQIVDSINNIIFKINDQHQKNIIAKYKVNESEYLEVQCFVIRKLFIYYMQVLFNSLKEVNNEEIQAIKYNVDEAISKIIKDDNWILANNLIKDNISKNIIPLEFKAGVDDSLQDKKNEFVNTMKNCDNKVEWIRLIVSLNSVSSIKNDILTNAEVHKMMSKIDNMLLDFIDFYLDRDAELIQTYFNSEEDFKYILAKLGYKYSEFYEGDRLDLELCKTLDVEATTDIEKDFHISKIYKQGVLKNNSVIRKALVNVYRFKND